MTSKTKPDFYTVTCGDGIYLDEAASPMERGLNRVSLVGPQLG